jgi:hypothetical protein
MNQPKPQRSDDEWLRADQPGPPLTTLLRQRRGLILGALALALVLAVIVVGERPATPSAKPSPVGSSSLTATPFFGLFPVFAYDADQRQVVLLNFHRQTWLWSNHQWVQAHPPVAPQGRTGAAVAWDPDMHAVLLFGGQASANQALLNDTWAWDGSSWRDVGTARLAPPPSPMSAMTYDGQLHQMVLVQSDIRVGAPTQLWTWDGAAWHQRSVSGGPTSPLAAVGSEPGARTIVAIAGDCSGFLCRSQTWSWDGSWRQLRPAHEPSFAYYSMALVPDPISRQLLLVTVARDPLGPAHTETWSWDGRDWVGPQLNIQPSAEVRIVAATGDDGQGTVFAFEDVSRDFNTVRINAWEWTGTGWSPITATRLRQRLSTMGGHRSVD